MIAELGKISEFGQDDDLFAGVRPAVRKAGHGYAGDSAMRDDSFEQLFGPSPKVEHNFRDQIAGRGGECRRLRQHLRRRHPGRPMNATAAPKRSDVSGDRQAREALAAAIAEAERTKAAAAKARAAFERAERFEIDARTAVDLARKSIEKAAAAEGESIAALLENSVEAPAELGVVQSAKDKLADVEDRHAAAKSAAEHLKAQVTALEQDAKDAQKRAAAARNDVVILNVDAWIAAEEKSSTQSSWRRAP